MNPLDFLTEELRRLEEAALLREVRSLDSAQDPEVLIGDARFVLLASNNYVGLATDPRVVEAAAEAARRWGAGAGSARLITGGTRLHDDLESAIAAFKGTDDALLFSSGYLANVGAIPALAGEGDVIFSDELNHASVVDGARLAHARTHVYRHRDVDHLESLLRANASARRTLVVTDAVFSMDGDLAPLPALADLCDEHGAILMVDEAHATGVIGPGGRGAVAHFGLHGRVPVIMGTLSKALGAAGGFIAGDARLIAFLRNRARGFIFDTAMPAPVAAAALEAVRILQAEPWRPARARAHASALALGLRAQGFAVPEPDAAIIPVVVGGADAALALSATLREAGVLVPAIRPPSVPPGSARLRATTMATHTDEHLARALAAFAATAVRA